MKTMHVIRDGTTYFRPVDVLRGLGRVVLMRGDEVVADMSEWLFDRLCERGFLK